MKKGVHCTLFLLHKPLFRQIFALVLQHVVKELLPVREGDMAYLRVVHEGGNNVRAGCVHVSLNNFFNGFFEEGRGLRAATPHPAHCIRHLPLQGKAFGFAFDNKLGSVDTCLPLEGKVRRAAPRMRCSRSQPALPKEKSVQCTLFCYLNHFSGKYLRWFSSMSSKSFCPSARVTRPICGSFMKVVITCVQGVFMLH